MPTAADLIQETRSHLQSGSRTELNRLNGSITNSATTLTAEFSMGGIQRGAIIWIDLEAMYVWSVSGQVATVQRAYMGTTAATHADDAVIEVNPTWSDFQILRALNQEIQSYSSPQVGLFQMKVVDLTFSGARVGYDLTSVTDILDVYDVRWADYGSWKSWPRVRGWVLARNQSTTDFASGKSLTITDVSAPGRTVRVQYSAPFTTLSALSTDLNTTGLPTTAYDIPPLGAAARLTAPREVVRARIDVQPEPRRAAEVQPGTSQRAAGGLLALRNQRLVEEAARLSMQYPPIDSTIWVTA